MTNPENQERIILAGFSSEVPVLRRSVSFRNRRSGRRDWPASQGVARTYDGGGGRSSQSSSTATGDGHGDPDDGDPLDTSALQGNPKIPKKKLPPGNSGTPPKTNWLRRSGWKPPQ